MKKTNSKQEVISFKFLPKENQLHVVLRECFEDVSQDLAAHRIINNGSYGNTANYTIYNHIRIFKHIYGVVNGQLSLLHIIPGEYIPANYQNASYSFNDNTSVDLV